MVRAQPHAWKVHSRVRLLHSSQWHLVVLLLVLGFFTLFSLDKMSFHGDESFYISEGIHAFSLVREGRLLDPWWTARSGFYTVDPPVSELIFGMAEYLAGTPSGSWYFYSACCVVGQIPPLHVLWVARVVSGVVAMLTLPLVYLIGRKLNGHFTGLMAVILLGFETLWLLSARRAMADIFGVIFSIAGILLFLVYVNSMDFRALLLCGIAQGLALASKYNVVFGLVATAILLLILSKKRFSLRDLVVSEVVLVGSSIAMLLLLNPYFYSDPIHGALALVKFMSGGFGFASLSSVASAAQSNPIETLLDVVGSLLVPIPQMYPGGTYTTVAMSILFVIGFVKLVSEVGKGPNRNITGTVLLTWAGVYVLGLSLTDKAIWISRYYLPLIPLISLIAAYGLSILVKGMGPRLSALTVSLLTLSMVFNVLAFYPEFYQATWRNAGDFPSQFGTLQLAVLRPLGMISVVVVALAFAMSLFWRRSDAFKNPVQAHEAC